MLLNSFHFDLVSILAKICFQFFITAVSIVVCLFVSFENEVNLRTVHVSDILPTFGFHRVPVKPMIAALNKGLAHTNPVSTDAIMGKIFYLCRIFIGFLHNMHQTTPPSAI